MSSTKKSIIWDYFDPDEKKKNMAKCKICHKFLSRGGTEAHKMTTTNLRNHLKNTHKSFFKKLESNQSESITKRTLDTMTESSTSKRIDEMFKPKEKRQKNQSNVEEKEINISTPSTSTDTSLTQVSLEAIINKKTMMDGNEPKARKITNLIGEMICLDIQPYSIVEDRGFRKLMKHISPRYRMPSRKHMSEKVVPLLYEDLKTKVYELIGKTDFLSLTTDGWTSKHGLHSFYSLTARFISEDFKVKCIILQLTDFPESHTGYNIGNFIKNSIRNWNIPVSKIQAIVADNAANMKSAVRKAGLEDIYIGCAIHSMQLSIQDKLFKNQRSVNDMLAILRNLATHLHKSPTSLQHFKQLQTQLGVKKHAIIQDVTTRWNSTYDMLSRFVEQKKVIVLFCMEKNMKGLTDDQWKLAETLETVLERFKEETLNMSSNQASISVIIPFIESMTKYIDYAAKHASGIKTIIEELYEEFKSRFSIYRTKNMLRLAMILDPRFKLKFIEDDDEKEIIKILLSNEMKNLLRAEKEKNNEIPELSDQELDSQSSTGTTSGSDTASSPCNKLKNLGDIYSFFQNAENEKKPKEKKKRSQRNMEQRSKKCMDEINNYLALPDIKINGCPYDWWAKYKFTTTSKESLVLADLARKYLCIPPTSVMSERLFSTTGNIFEATRNRLTPEHGEQLSFVHCNYETFYNIDA